MKEITENLDQMRWDNITPVSPDTARKLEGGPDSYEFVDLSDGNTRCEALLCDLETGKNTLVLLPLLDAFEVSKLLGE